MPLRDPAHPDLGALQALARLLMSVRRAGGRLYLRGPADQALFDLVGLVLQPVGDAEAGEQSGIQEVVHVGDATG